MYSHCVWFTVVTSSGGVRSWTHTGRNDNGARLWRLTHPSYGTYSRHLHQLRHAGLKPCSHVMSAFASTSTSTCANGDTNANTENGFETFLCICITVDSMQNLMQTQVQMLTFTLSVNRPLRISPEYSPSSLHHINPLTVECRVLTVQILTASTWCHTWFTADCQILICHPHHFKCFRRFTYPRWNV